MGRVVQEHSKYASSPEPHSKHHNAAKPPSVWLDPDRSVSTPVAAHAGSPLHATPLLHATPQLEWSDVTNTTPLA